jgi:hypothetical protein
MRRHAIKSFNPSPAENPRSPDVVEGVVDGALLRPALMLFKIGLQLRFGLIGIRYKFAACPEG